MAKYGEMENVEAGLRFKTESGLIVETTGITQVIESNGEYVHEVAIAEGEHSGNKYLHALDSAQKI